jgi:hypothetical protein
LSKNKDDNFFSFDYQIKIEVTSKNGNNTPKVEVLLKEKKPHLSTSYEGSSLSGGGALHNRLSVYYEYLEQHLENAFETFILNLLEEANYVSDDMEPYRKEMLNSLLVKQEKALRKRLGIKRGPQQDWYAKQMEEINFITDCIIAIERLKEKNAKINQSTIAELAINQEGDPQREFRRKIKKFGLTVTALLEIHGREENRSLIARFMKEEQ